MEFEPSVLSLFPPLLAIGLAIWTRQVYVALAAGILLGWTLLAGGNPAAGVAGAIDGVVEVIGDPGNARILMFSLLIGALVIYVEASGGVEGFVRWLEGRRLVEGTRGAGMLAWLIGIVIFIESNITLLVAGAVCRPLFDRYRAARERLAYIADSTSAPICILIPFNAWGALILGLLGGLAVADPLRVFVQAIPLNLYAIAAVLLAGFTAWTGVALGPMRKADARAAEGVVLSPEGESSVDEELFKVRFTQAPPPRAVNMVLPIVVMVVMMPVGLLVTGGGVLGEGSGSTSALWAVIAGNTTAVVMILVQRFASLDELVRVGLKGLEALLGLVLILLLAITLGDVCIRLGTGTYVAEAVRDIARPALLVPATFAAAAFVAFATGTSWGTFAIMVPIAVPAAEALGLPLAPFLAASLSGGIFGDHASPISDTTIVASLASATDVIDHVRTQLPYALIAAGVALVGFAIVGSVI
ncbi:MAG: C4-dicarboxylate ABC transporter [Gemmatimonadetes bacterium]|uniref:C4-dicarboxylate ABC transporter n=1 Tax=Candidatus Kutchimonas denitrificans TaxID=3056748 RepID=A0AAE4Z5Z4_9BACT|nr:C4-dicarboxylate ABC transporter [Gemmatimonadota bacterium]NIR74198.1 C4-dicarboxylate ABC transporter [Candidatus Kutchimonas denitrificans]NIR99820.1 C4-dicarboxylate ABC transporter [Gemmatimonadota bacterium]NIT65409.1 C4-dicarboxylate ABC transporter [Gemmatimonadota bacterium]NIU51775.1 C4-dicarboxylate ABC transporter [Gemmatimonadota bacterium]